MLSSLVSLVCFGEKITNGDFDVILGGIKKLLLFLEDVVVVIATKGNRVS